MEIITLPDVDNPVPICAHVAVLIVYFARPTDAENVSAHTNNVLLSNKHISLIYLDVVVAPIAAITPVRFDQVEKLYMLIYGSSLPAPTFLIWYDKNTFDPGMAVIVILRALFANAAELNPREDHAVPFHLATLVTAVPPAFVNIPAAYILLASTAQMDSTRFPVTIPVPTVYHIGSGANILHKSVLTPETRVLNPVAASGVIPACNG
jgi:hypothetical protein